MDRVVELGVTIADALAAASHTPDSVDAVRALGPEVVPPNGVLRLRSWLEARRRSLALTESELEKLLAVEPAD